MNRLGAILAVCISTFSLESFATSHSNNLPGTQSVPHRVISMRSYANFPTWNSQQNPKLYACIRTFDEYKEIFHGVFEPGKPAMPPATLFDREQILVVGTIIQAVAPERWDEGFTVLGVEESGRHLTLRFAINPMESEATWSASNTLSVAIPQKYYETLTFVEGDETVAELDLANGHWSIPEVSR